MSSPSDLRTAFASVSQAAQGDAGLTRRVMAHVSRPRSLADELLVDFSRRVKAGFWALSLIALVSLLLSTAGASVPGHLQEVFTFSSLGHAQDLGHDLALESPGYPFALAFGGLFLGIVRFSVLIAALWVGFSLLTFAVPSEMMHEKEQAV